MVTDTEGIILRQIKAANGRRMILMFSKKFGKISVGSGLTEGGKSKSALSIRPFTHGRYEIFKGRDSYNLNGGQVIKSYYAIGENLDKYIASSYVLELTEKLLPEELAQPKLFNLLLSFLGAMERREKKQETLMLAYMVKLLDVLGNMPVLDHCVECGTKDLGKKRFFSVKDGGMLCSVCGERMAGDDNEPLIYTPNFGIVDILKYFRNNDFSTFEKIALDEAVLRELKIILKEYMAYHLDIGKLKSEEFSL